MENDLEEEELEDDPDEQLHGAQEEHADTERED